MQIYESVIATQTADPVYEDSLPAVVETCTLCTMIALRRPSKRADVNAARDFSWRELMGWNAHICESKCLPSHLGILPSLMGKKR